MEIRLFESFAGVGSQHTAFSNLQKDYEFNLEVSGISEWNIYSIIGYMLINDIQMPKGRTGFSKQELIEYLSMFNYSIDGKDVAGGLSSLSFENLELIFYAQHLLNNTPDINNLKGQTLIDKKTNVFTYSFPCQDLSLAGKRKGMTKGEGTRSSLLWEVERVLDEIVEIDREKLPKFLLMENVPQIISEQNVDDYQLWKDYLNSLGYTTFDGLVNPVNFKFPQSRSRFFALSVLDYEGNADPIIPIFEHITRFKNEDYGKASTLAKCLKTDYNDVKHIEYLLEALEATPNHTESRLKMFENERALTDENGVPKNNRSKFQYCSTITTKQDRWHNAGVINFDKKMFDDGTRSTHRLITPRESFLLMGYKNKQFARLKASGIASAELYKMAGNSIAVPVLELIFETFILSNYLGIEND